MADMQDFHNAPSIVHRVVNNHRRVNELPDMYTIRDFGSHAWEAAQLVDVVEHRDAKLRGCNLAIARNIGEQIF